jgi:hypothetical protein
LEKWRTNALQTIRAALATAGTDHRNATFAQERSRDRLATALAILTRVLVRDNSAALDELWTLAKSLYVHESIRSLIVIRDRYGSFIQSLANASELQLLETQLLSLGQLPLPGEPNLVVMIPDRWVDPMEAAAYRLAAAARKLNPKEWGPTTRRYAQLLKSEDVHVRQGALGRLFFLKDLGVIAPTVQTQISRTFWARMAGERSQAWVAWGVDTPYLALSWPTRNPSARERVREHLLGRQLGEVHGGIVRPDDFFKLALFASKPLRFKGEPNREFIAWTASDLDAIVAKISDWWNTYGKKQATAKDAPRHPWIDDTHALRAYFNGLWDVLRELVIPRIRKGPATKRVAELIEDIRQTGLPVGAILPALLMVDPARQNQVTSRLRYEFAHPNVDFFLSSLRGVVYWADVDRTHPARRKLPKVPVELIRMIASAVEFRRHNLEALRLSLDAALAIIRRHGKNSDPRFRDSLIIGLDYLYAETTYRNTAEISPTIPYVGVPQIRTYCALIAVKLSQAGSANNEVVKRWLVAARADPLPEVRRAIESDKNVPLDAA